MGKDFSDKNGHNIVKWEPNNIKSVNIKRIDNLISFPIVKEINKRKIEKLYNKLFLE